jgi:hypothetical protein
MSTENEIKELERSFPDLRQKLDIHLVGLISRLASRFTGDREKDLALLRGTMELLFKARDHDKLWKRVEDNKEYALRIIEHVRLYRHQMKQFS